MTSGAQRLAAGVVSAGLLAGALAAAPPADAQQSVFVPGEPAPKPPAAPAAPPPVFVPDPAPKTTPRPAPPEVPVPPAEQLLPAPGAAKAPEPTMGPQRLRKRRPAKDAEAADDAATRAAASSALLDAIPGDAPADVPSFFIDSFRVPVFLLPIYQAAGIQYGVRWEILAAINEIETDYGRNLNVSSAGATGWMQFMPATWRSYGVDANRDRIADPYNPVDSIFAAARYLQAAGAQDDLRKAVFAYNHAGWYVDSVLQRAQRLAALPADLVGALSGLAQGRTPVLGPARPMSPRVNRGQRTPTLRLNVRDGARVVAVTDGEVVRTGYSARLGRFVRLRDVFGNLYTYGELAGIAQRYPMLRSKRGTPRTAPAAQTLPAAPVTPPLAELTPREPGPVRVAAAPATGGPLAAIDWADQALRRGIVTVKPAATPPPPRPLRGQPSSYDLRLLGGVSPARVAYRPLREGSRVVAGTVLGRAGVSTASPARVRFEIRPAGRKAPRIDPRPIIAGWKLLQASSRGAPALGPKALPSVGQVLLLSKPALQSLVLGDPRIVIYPCGREDVRAGLIDRRVLATLATLAASGLSPTVSSLNCGHGRLTSSGNVSEHTSGSAVDIAAINGVPIIGNQGPGSITETAVRRLLTLQGTMRPHQIISLMTFGGATNTLAMADHADHIHVGFTPEPAPSSLSARLFDGALEPQAWRRLIDRLATIGNPRVRRSVSVDSIPADPKGP